ncbi:MAG: SIR2 family protein [Lachnospiraceae bacterium]|nr:SIR2 family protein [Lachnospiraceae bacterium]
MRLISRPILLIGNGLNRSFAEKSVEVNDLIKGKKRLDIPDGEPISFPLKAVLLTCDEVDKHMKNISANMWGELRIGSPLYQYYKRILELPVTDILTTNYDFLMEEAAYDNEKIGPSDIDKTRDYIKVHGLKRAESKMFLHTYQKLPYNKKLWHIHGHAKNFDSMIIGHYYYGKYLYKIIDYVEKNRDRYFWSNPEKFEIRSWIDAFLFSDIYVLGFGCNYAEMDIWWLLNQKKREYTKRDPCKVCFYEPKCEDNRIKHELLKCYGVEVIDMGIEVKTGIDKEKTPKEYEENCKRYEEFYYKALDDIKERTRRF